ncbi:MAG: TraR/DksA family transcriptional regulator [Kofleriaceae bacterium]
MSRYHGELERLEEEQATRDSEDVENATELWDVHVLSKLSDVDIRALRDIAAALRRLDDGRYGLCVECGMAIEPARLSAVPEAATCFECALDAERSATVR